MAAFATHLPNAIVGFPLGLFQMVNKYLLDSPRILILRNPVPSRQMQGVEHFAENVQLELLMGRVADSDGPRVFVTGKPIQFQLRQSSLAGQPVHDS